MLSAKGAAGGGDPLGESIPVDGGRDIQLGPAGAANLPAKGRERGHAGVICSAGDAILDGYHNGYRTSCRNSAMTCGNAVGGTRFELVTSSVSGKIREPLTSNTS
jgi:hypothetical protein